MAVCRPDLQRWRGSSEQKSAAADHLQLVILNHSSTTSLSESLQEEEEREVTKKMNESNIIQKIKSLQEKAAYLMREIERGEVKFDSVSSGLKEMMEEQEELCEAVDLTSSALELVNKESDGRAAKYIAICQDSFCGELKRFAEQLSTLSGVFHNTSNIIISTTSPVEIERKPISLEDDNDRGLPIIIKTTSPPSKEKETTVSPCLPDIYLTPSRPSLSAISPSSYPLPLSETDTSVLASSPPSSLSQLDPFTPDTISAPPTREHSGVHQPYSGDVAITPLTQTALNSVTSPVRRAEKGELKTEATHSSVLQWIKDTSYHMHVGTEKEEEEEEVDRNEWGRGGRGGGRVESPGGSEETRTTVTATELSPPPISSPCGDSGISSSRQSGGHFQSSISHHISPPPPLPHSVTMSDIEAMKKELAKLRQEIRDTSNWTPSLSLGHSYSKSSLPAPYYHYQPSTPSSSSCYSSFYSRVRLPANDTLLCQTPRPAGLPLLQSTPVVSRPYHHHHSHSHTLKTPVSQTSSYSHKRLFSTPHSTLLLEPPPQLVVEHSTQTLPVSKSHSGTRSRYGTGSGGHSSSLSKCYSSSSTLTSDPGSRPSLSHLPENFTPHLVVHSHQNYPSISSSSTSFLPPHPHPSSSSHQHRHRLHHYSNTSSSRLNHNFY